MYFTKRSLSSTCKAIEPNRHIFQPTLSSGSSSLSPSTAINVNSIRGDKFLSDVSLPVNPSNTLEKPTEHSGETKASTISTFHMAAKEDDMSNNGMNLHIEQQLSNSDTKIKGSLSFGMARLLGEARTNSVNGEYRLFTCTLGLMKNV